MFMFFRLILKKLAVSSLSILGYIGVTIPMTVLTGRWLGKLVEHNNNSSISEKNKAAYVQLTISAVLVLVSSLYSKQECRDKKENRVPKSSIPACIRCNLSSFEVHKVHLHNYVVCMV